MDVVPQPVYMVTVLFNLFNDLLAITIAGEVVGG